MLGAERNPPVFEGLKIVYWKFKCDAMLADIDDERDKCFTKILIGFCRYDRDTTVTLSDARSNASTTTQFGMGTRISKSTLI